MSKIITNKEALLSFIDWLPELAPNEKFYLSLFARKKYTKSNIPSQVQLLRFTATKESILRKIQSLEQGFTYKGVEIPHKALALYILPNPRNIEKATQNTIKEFVDLVVKPYSGYNPEQVLLTQIHKAKSYTKYQDFDFDGVTEQLALIKIIKHINIEACTFVRTRGGFHLLVEPSKVSEQDKKTYYQSLRTLEGCDTVGDSLLPVVGCTQGGFTPEFITF